MGEKRNLLMMLKKKQENRVTFVAGSVSVTASLTTIALATLITPQIILRAFNVGKASAELFIAFGVGLAIFIFTCVAVNGVTRLTPRRATHQLANRFIGPWAGILVGAARILLQGLLVLLGAELVVTAVVPNDAIDTWSKPLAVILILLLTIPTVASGTGKPLRWPRVLAFMAVLGLVAVLAWGLIQEFLGAIDFYDVVFARSDAFKSESVRGAQGSIFESLLGGCFPAAIVFAVSERVMAAPERRRVPMRRMLTMFIPMLILIGVTMYFVVVLQLPARRLGLPVLSITYAFWGFYGRMVLAGLVAAMGLSVATAAYRQMPRTFRELAIDGILPRRLIAEDAVVPRRIIVVLMAVVLAVISWFLDSTSSLAMVFIVVAFFIGFVLSCAMCARSRSILNDSTEQAERTLARNAQWMFRFYGLIILMLIGLVAFVQPLWLLVSVLSLAVPVVFLLVHRKGAGKLTQALASDIDAPGRVLPTRVHSFVLVERLDLPTLKALDWARANRGSSLQALCVDVDRERTRQLRKDWLARQLPVALTVVGTPAGAVRGPVIEFVRAFRRMHPDDVVMIYYSRVISTGSWERFFVRHTTPSIISELELEPGVMVTKVPYRIESSERAESADAEN